MRQLPGAGVFSLRQSHSENHSGRVCSKGPMHVTVPIFLKRISKNPLTGSKINSQPEHWHKYQHL